MKSRLLLLLLWLIVACAPTRNSSRVLKTDSRTNLPVAKYLYQLDNVPEGLLKGRNGVLFRVSNAEEEEDREEDAPADPCKSQPKLCDDPFFRGCDRKTAKLSFSKKKANKIPLSTLMQRLMSSNLIMRNHEAISSSSLSARVTEEQENVWLERVFVYVILRENDGDYHLIVGDGRQTAPETLLGIEISALPETTSPYYGKLKEVRDKFERRYRTCSRKNLWERGDALPEISVKGALFFDLLHARQGKHSGDKSIKTGTWWEIHPVTEIKFWN